MGDCDIERFIFPDGTERDMLVFDPSHDAPCPTAPPPTDTRDPHLCPVCGSPLVHPTEWQRIAVAAWRITLRCPNCETLRTVVLDRGQVELLNRALYEGTEHLSRQADLLVRHNFEEEADKFVAALDADLILPIDF
jgi:Zn-finger nucleic acid-binding protein